MENELEVVNIRLVKEPSLYSEQTLDSPQAVVELMAKELSQYDREVFCILNMKNNGQVINMNLVSVGTINASLVIPREVFKSSILANASAIIGLHNHPSGNVKPSKEDMIVTRKLQKCGQLLGIELLDHIIVGGTNGKMLSFREEKMLNVTGRMDWERQKKKELEVFIYCNISCSGISKIMSLQKTDLYIDIICITQNKIVKNRKKQYITKKSLNKKNHID